MAFACAIVDTDFRWRRLKQLFALFAVLILALLTGCASRTMPPLQVQRAIEAKRPNVACLDACQPIPSAFSSAVEQGRPKSDRSRPKHFLLSLERGDDALIARIHLIRSAKRTLDMQTFIFSRDDSGLFVLDELIKAARRGVKVRVLSDQLFSIDDLTTLARLTVAHPNFEVKYYNPTFGQANTSELEFLTSMVCCFWRLNRRMHNKLMIADGAVAITGGRNVDNRYFDLDPQFVYRDRDVLVIGRVLGQVVASFDAYWQHPLAVDLRRLKDVGVRVLTLPLKSSRLTLPEDLARSSQLKSIRNRALDPDWTRERFLKPMVRADRVEYWSDRPGKASSEDRLASAQISQQIHNTLSGTQRSLTLQTPYLVLSRKARRLLRNLKTERPDVRILVSTNSLASTDAFYVYALSHKHKKTYVRELGFEIFETKPFPASSRELIGFYDELSQVKRLPSEELEANTQPKVRRWYRQPGSAIRVMDTEGGLGRPLPLRAPERLRVGLHAKSFVLDSQITLIGSHNFDPRSDDLNTESGLIIWDGPFARAIEAQIFRDAAPENAWAIAPKQRVPGLAEVNMAFSRLFYAIPFFDIWPFRYSTSYALREGFAPVSRFDPQFFVRYEPVGDFPEVDLPLKQINTLVISAFFGWIAPIL